MGIPARKAMLALALTLALVELAAARPALAQQTNVSISMQAAAAAPRIGGALVVGVRPGTPLVHTIAVHPDHLRQAFPKRKPDLTAHAII